MKKTINVIICLVMLFSMTVNAFASTVTIDYETIRKAMIEYGMPESVVNTLPDIEVAKYANIEATSVDKHYYKFTEIDNENMVRTSNHQEYTVEEVSEEECISAISEISPLGTIGSSYMETTITVARMSGRRYLVSATYRWISEPIFQINDYFGLSIHNNLVMIPDTVVTCSEYDYGSLYDSNIHTVSYFGGLINSGMNGHCMEVPWEKDDDYYTYMNFRGYMSYQVEVAEVGSNGTVNSLVYLVYAHKTLIPNFGVTFSYPTNAAISIGPSISFDYLYQTTSFTHYE